MSDTTRVTVRSAGPDSCHVRVAGELDVASAPQVRDVLHSALESSGRVSVDLSALWFCDCAGLSALISAARTARAHDADLRLLAVPHCLARLLRLTHTRSVFTIDPAADPHTCADTPDHRKGGPSGPWPSGRRGG